MTSNNEIPTIPMSPDSLPQQRIVALKNLVKRPEPFDSVVGWGEKPKGVDLPNGPRKAEYLGQVEWAWSPMNNRLDAYYISRSRTHWILWIYSYDDNWGKWEWLAIGNVPLKQASCREASIHLLIDFWNMEKQITTLDHFHWINEDGELDVSDWRTIALNVWPEVAAQRIIKEDGDEEEEEE